MKNIVLALSTFFFILNSPVQANKIDSLTHILNEWKDDTSKIKVIFALSMELIQKGDIDKARQNLTEALFLSRKLNFKKGEGQAYNDLGIIFNNIGNYSEALKNHYLGLNIRKGINDRQGISDSYNNIGIVYWKQSNYSKALESHITALKIRREIRNRKASAASYNNLGIIFSEQANYSVALKNHLAALKIKEEIGDEIGMAASYNNIGNIYWKQINYSEALRFHYSALRIREKINDKSGVAASYGNLGNIYYEQGNLSAALSSNLIALKISKELKDKAGLANCYNNIGSIYNLLKNFPEALNNFTISLKLRKEIGNKEGVAASCVNMGETYNNLNRYLEAKKYLMYGLMLAKEIENNEDKMDCYKNLSILYNAQGNWKEAYNYHKLYIIYRDSIYNEENTKKLVQTQMQYDFDKKETATKAEHDKKEALAQAEINKQKIIRNSIAGGAGILVLSFIFSFLFYKRKREASFKNRVSEVEMKALRSQMNPHFIFNSLNSIKRYMANHDNKTAEDYLTKFASVMRMILENSEHKEISLQQDLKALELYMQLESLRMKKKFNYEIKVDESIDAENALIPPLILQPFVENSIWHGLAEKEGEGKISISIIKIGEMIECTVEDNGVGRKKSEEAKGGYANIEKKSLGMKITNARIDILNKIKKSKAGVELVDLAEGMKVIVRLPLELIF